MGNSKHTVSTPKQLPLCGQTTEANEGQRCVRGHLHDSPSRISWPRVGGWESSVRKSEVCAGLRDSLCWGLGLELVLLSTLS